MNTLPQNRIEWLSDLVRLEIRLWNQVDARLREAHDLPLAYFWPLYVVGHTPDKRLRVGELAEVLGITVGGTSKIVDRIERIGFLRREPDATDRRASRIALTAPGRSVLDAASTTYEAEMATLLGTALTLDEQRSMHRLISRLLDALDVAEPA